MRICLLTHLNFLRLQLLQTHNIPACQWRIYRCATTSFCTGACQEKQGRIRRAHQRDRRAQLPKPGSIVEREEIQLSLCGRQRAQRSCAGTRV